MFGLLWVVWIFVCYLRDFFAIGGFIIGFILFVLLDAFIVVGYVGLVTYNLLYL